MKNVMALERSYQDKLRILLIIYYFSKPCTIDGLPFCKRLMKSELKIQKIDFLIRNPDYLAIELLDQVQSFESEDDKEKIQHIIKEIFHSGEPDIRKKDMLRFFFGAYEDIDDIIAFFVARNFLHFVSRRSIDRRVFEKEYYLTEHGIQKIENEILPGLPKINWYVERCKLINKYFGDLSGTELKARQYQYDEYRLTPLNEPIVEIKDKVIQKYKELFGVNLCV